MAGYFVPEKLHARLDRMVVVDAAALDWTPSPMPGVERRFLERDGGEVARATSLVRYAPGSAFSPHVHEGGEEYLVLDGVFSDERGDFPAGAYVRNPPGSRHAPRTAPGCTIFVKLRQMRADERDTVELQTRDLPAAATAVPGLSRIALFERAGVERVAIEILAPGCRWPRGGGDEAAAGGEEILVIDGTLAYGDLACRAGTWLRVPAGQERDLASRDGCRLWVKRGHLRC